MAAGLETANATVSSTAVATKPEESPPVDEIVLRLEVEDHCTLPVHLLYNCSTPDMATSEDLSPKTQARLSGQRQLHEIHVETYSQSCTPAHAPLAEYNSQSVIGERLPFFSGIPSVEVVKGLLHLYKPTMSRSNSSSSSMLDKCRQVLCVLNIPAHMQLSDMLDFLSPVLPTVTRLRVIRDPTPNQYMLLVSFKDRSSARHFYSNFNGKPYNSLEVSACWLVVVLRVEVMKSSQGASLPSLDLTELPSCPVCLERLDDSVLTILCNHSFHVQCLTRWEDSTCPICRYTQTPEPCTQENTCFSCDSKEDLWICLICGHIGCGRYVQAHAHLHYMDTQHTFSMQLGRIQRVWDYIADNYVHRLVQNKADGKLVEVGYQGQPLPSDQKMDSLQLEYSYLLSSQLDTQRLFFEEKMACIEKDLTEQLQVVESRCRVAVSEKEDLEAKVMEVEKERRASDKKNHLQQIKLSKIAAELKEEKEMNKCMSTNQKLWRDRVETLEHKIDVTIQQKEKEMKDLQEQVRDLMFYLETQKKVEDSPDSTRQELQAGQVHVVIPTPPNPSSSNPSSSNPSSSASTARKPRRKK